MHEVDEPYSESAELYDLIYNFLDLPSHAEAVADLISTHLPSSRSLLDVGCGTGRHLEVFSRTHRCVGVDLSDEMIGISGVRCPGVDLHTCDMADMPVYGVFDVVTCLFRAVGYMTTAERLRSAVGAMAANLRSGGLLILEPWLSKEQYWVDHLVVNHARDEQRAVTWMYVQKLVGDCSRFDIAFMVGDSTGVRTFTERHDMGLFSLAEYARAFDAAGLDATYDPVGPSGRGLYSAWRR